MMWKIGEKYVGRFKDRNRVGWGKETLPNGDTLEGRWEIDKTRDFFICTLDSGKISEQWYDTLTVAEIELHYQP